MKNFNFLQSSFKNMQNKLNTITSKTVASVFDSIKHLTSNKIEKTEVLMPQMNNCPNANVSSQDEKYSFEFENSRKLSVDEIQNLKSEIRSKLKHDKNN